MRPELAAIAGKQWGLVTRGQALEAGYTAREIRSLTRVNGPWVVVRRGVYCLRQTWDRKDRYDGTMALQDRAVHLTTPVMHVLSHESAARAHQLPIWRPAAPFVHLTRPLFTGSRSEHGVKHHCARVLPGEVETVDGLPVTNLARTAIDLARCHGPTIGLSACDSAMRAGVPREHLYDELALMTSWPGVTTARTAAELADPGADNPAESVTRHLLLELGRGVPETQFPVRTARGPAWVDLRLGRLLIEFDGRQKYVDRDDGGLAGVAPGDVVWHEKLREDDVRDEGFLVVRIVFDQLLPSAWTATSDFLLERVTRAARMFGTELTETQRRYAADMAHLRLERIRRSSRAA